ncbi:MAG: helix-turn-helix transcriptional regulator [Cellulomonadaceae bacterium]
MSVEQFRETPIPRSIYPAATVVEDGLAAVVAGRIRVEAMLRGLSQADLGDIVGLSRSSVGHRFPGRVPWTLDEVGRLAAALGCPVGDLVPPRSAAGS